jgi:hypothetical protein
MSAVIRLDHMLREATDMPYRNLVTRPTGAAVRHRVVSTLRGRDSLDAQLDFSHVGLVDFSCADEVVAKLLVVAADLPLIRLVLLGVREDHAEAIEHALICHGLAVVAFEADTGIPRLLGAVSEDWQAAFTALRHFGRSTALPVAEKLAWDVSRARTALDELAGSRCLLAHNDATYELGVFG